MPLMGCDAFCDAHHRPFLICAEVEEGGAQRLGPLRRYIRSLELNGNFAWCHGGSSVRVVFESEKEAVRIARNLGAKKVGRGDKWAGQWAFVLNEAAAIKITSADHKPKRRAHNRTLQRGA